jgi:Cof subfamily protein (haloacid dehalogenase superfamily)
MDTKILFFDIDGTIISNETHEISENTKNAIRQAKANGHLVFINTGRTLAGITPEIKEIGFDGYVCGCGTYIDYNGSKLLHERIPSELHKDLIGDFNEHQIEALLEGSTHIYYNDRLTEQHLLPPKDIFQNLFEFTLIGWHDVETDFDKMCIRCEDPERYQMIYDKYKDTFEFIKRDAVFYEIIPANFSKATGIEYLIKHLGIPHENTYAFGDSTNDLSMLTYVKHSIGMGVSDQQVLDIVTFHTKNVEDNGIEYALKHFEII